VEYVQDKQSVQIISRIFIDDLEKALRQNYDENITLDENNEQDLINNYIEKYINANVVVFINGESTELEFIGKEYDGDIMRFYIEIPEVQKINAFNVSNIMLFDVCPDQQNIMKTKIYGKHKSVILTKKDTSALLKFN